MPNQLRADWVAAAFSTGTVVTEAETVAFTTHRLPDLLLPSGRIGASDPLVTPKAEIFSFRVDPGAYPVELAIGQFGVRDQRVAFARITFVEASVQSWRVATTRGQAPSTLGPSEIFGYGVDSGTGCFMSLEAGVLLEARMERNRNYFEAIVKELDKTYRPTWAWADFRPEPHVRENLIAFSTGFGDGVYASYVGSDDGRRPVCLVTDFGTLFDPAAEPPE